MRNFKTRRYINSFTLMQNPNAPEVFTNDNKALCTFQNLVPVNTPGKNYENQLLKGMRHPTSEPFCLYILQNFLQDILKLEYMELLTVQSVSNVFSETKDPSRPKRKIDA